ncbi:MAG: PQQ-binding-like beta-propeller repeat protein [Planctomycetaceae bacterium]|nr:PQQ-binding-like beta-propeller repeat protein [Planctomycetaceae bacterium]
MIESCKPHRRAMTGRLGLGSVLAWCLGICNASFLQAADWPMWRYDAGRTAASPEELPANLQLLWTRAGTPRIQAWDDPLNLDLMTYDRLFEPVVLEGRLFVGYNDRDKLTALDAETGKELWSFFSDAPVRLPPAAGQGSVYFTSDDGRLYCLDAETGKLRWQFQGAIGSRHVIGNRRLISAWPARGGVVLREGKVYFASSIWPFMGVFIYALDAQTGAVEWVNDSAGATYIKQPHSAPSFAGVAPQGALVATEHDLIVPGGRSVPAVLDRKTGALRYFELNAGGKGSGGSFVAANDSVYFVHTRLKGVREFNLAKGDKTAFQPNEPVLLGNYVFSAEVNKENLPVVRAYNAERTLLWEIAADGRGDLILAGTKLYAAGPSGLCAIQLPTLPEEQPRVVWSASPEGQIERLLAASGKLFAVTQEGHILAFGEASADAVAPPTMIAETDIPLAVTDAEQGRATRLLSAGNAEGYALWYGAAEESLLDAVAKISPFVELAVVDEEALRVERLRHRWDAAGLYGRVTVRHSPITQFDASPYMAHMIFVGTEWSARLAADKQALARIYESLRPYGGVLHLLVDVKQQAELLKQVEQAALERAVLQTTSDGILVRREGPLPGAADWTHQHGDIGNTRKSNDSRVKLPLGILWFGGSSHMDVLPRHGHGPPQQVVDGRLIIQGINVLSARDVYTGRVLWKREFEDLGTYDVYYDETYKEVPLDTAYNQVHIPGANARGTNFVVTPERIYIVEGAVCRLLDPASGEILGSIEMPQDDPLNPREWSYIGVYGDVLIGGLGFARYRDRHQLSFEEEDAKLKGNKAGFGSKSLDRAGSLALVGFDRLTGKQLWRIDARHSFWNNAIVAGNGKIYCLDRNPRLVEEKLKRRGLSLPESYRLIAVEARTGNTVWQKEGGIFGTWLGYSEQFDLLLQAGAAASDRLTVETDQGMTVYRGEDGSVVWSKPDLKYSGPCILHNDLIITNANSYKESAGAFYLKNGEPYLISNPLTGEQVPWKITRAYGCNTILASENLLTFRSGAAGFYDLTTHGGTGNFGGFKSGCTGNLIAAGGVLNAPDYTRTCSCTYQNQTSLALVHMPEIELWTVNALAQSAGNGRPVQTVGINLGAPGQSRDQNGILWLEWPRTTTEAFPISLEIDANARYVRRHSSVFAGREDSAYSWILASGLEGAEELRIGTVLHEEQSQEPQPQALHPYQIRLFFGYPPGTGTGPRVFDVAINDITVLRDVALSEGNTEIRELPVMELASTFRLRLIGKQGTPILSGIELKRVSN